MSNNMFNIGDTVCLNSGGPLMTVVEMGVGETGQLRCQWFDDDGQKYEEHFPPAAVQKIDPEDGPLAPIMG